MYRDDVLRHLSKWAGEELNYSVTVFERRCVVVEGHKGIKSYDAKCVTFRISKIYISIYGTNISISEINDNDAIVLGLIDKVEYHE